MPRAFRNRASFGLSVCIVGIVLLIPWPDARGPSIGRSIWITVRDLNRSAAHSVGRFDTFQANLNTPGSGEHVLPVWVQQALTILRGRGRQVKRYQLSPAFMSNDWVLQQMVASAWPRKLDPHATARFVVNTEPVEPDCTLIDKQQDVSLVYCP